jgi:hypothetical protein
MARAFAADSVNLHAWSAGVDTVKRLLVPFQNESGLNVNYNNLPFAQYREAMVTKFVGQAPIDVLWVSDGWLPEWADAGWLAPLDGYPQLLSLLPVGSDQFIGLQCLGQSMFFRVGKERSCKVGERVTLSINRRRLHLFDQASGANLKAQNA